MSATLIGYFDSHFLPRKTVRWSKNTERLHRVALRHLERFLARPPALADLNDDTLSSFLSWRLQSVSCMTANRDVEKLLTLWRFAAKRNDVAKFPTVEFAIEPKRVPRAWSRDDLKKLFAAIDSLDGYVGKVPSRKWWRCLLLCLFDTGERIGAILGLEWQDVDLERQWIVCRAEHRKGRKSDRSYKLAVDTVAELGPISKSHGKVFDWPLDKTLLWKYYGRILVSAGLPDDRRSKFHRIRRSTASHAKAAGADPQQLLDHVSRATTLLYLDPTICQEASAIDYLFRPGN